MKERERIGWRERKKDQEMRDRESEIGVIGRKTVQRSEHGRMKKKINDLKKVSKIIGN